MIVDAVTARHISLRTSQKFLVCQSWRTKLLLNYVELYYFFKFTRSCDNRITIFGKLVSSVTAFQGYLMSKVGECSMELFYFLEAS